VKLLRNDIDDKQRLIDHSEKQLNLLEKQIASFGKRQRTLCVRIEPMFV
jgi:hypothetical protein